jgi:hypothetical protein
VWQTTAKRQQGAGLACQRVGHIGIEDPSLRRQLMQILSISGSIVWIALRRRYPFRVVADSDLVTLM